MSGLNTLKSWRVASILVALMAAACAVTAQGQESSSGEAAGKGPMPEYIQEFFLSDSVRSQEKGELQVTFATDSRKRIGSNAEMEIEYGLTERLQISIEAPYGITAGQEETEDLPGWSSIGVGTLYQIIRGDRPFALSAGVMFEIPARPGDELGIQPTVLLAKAFHKLEIHASAVSDLREEYTELEYNVASVYPIKRRWFPTFEFNGRRENAVNSFYLTPGLYRHLGHRMEMGIGIPVGAGRTAAPIGAVAKMNWEWGGDDH